MAGIMKEYTIRWSIKNYSYCSHKNGELLFSPYITADGLEGTGWYFRLYPRGLDEEAKGYISLFLQRSFDDDGPNDFPLKYELSILAADGSTLVSNKLEYTYQKGVSFGVNEFLRVDEVFMPRKADYFKADMLVLCAKIWMGEGNLEKVTQISAKTEFEIKQFSFLHVTNSFSALQPNQKQTLQISYPSKAKYVLSSSVYFSDGADGDEKIMVEITPCSTRQILLKCKLYLVDSSGTLIKCGVASNQFEAERKDIQKLPLSLTKQAILGRKNDYLPDDKLSLFCNCMVSTGVIYSKIERISNELPIAALKEINSDQTEDRCNAAVKLSVCPNALDDFKSVYNNQLLTDVEIKTASKSFLAHKFVLCARSPVFRAMLTNDMEEKSIDCIQIYNLGNDTLQCLLSFLYCEDLKILDWKSAIKLYNAANEYGVKKLKVMCSAFLVDNLSTSTSGELLSVADMYGDSDLKKIVEDFIFKHEEQVFTSVEWENLIKTNAELVSRTMILKYKRKMSLSQQ